MVMAACGTGASLAQTVTPAAEQPAHKVAIQVSENDKAQMDLALNNARHVIEYYKARGETVAVEIVAYGPGRHMLRANTRPVKSRRGPMSLEYPGLKLVACGNTQTTRARPRARTCRSSARPPSCPQARCA